jgi:hypothetical protein
MKYMLLVCAEPVPEDHAAQTADLTEAGSAEEAPMPWAEEMDARGIRLLGHRLRPPSTATTVRLRDGAVLLGDGPFAETKEVIAGFDILDCADLDEAIEVASRHPVAAFGTMELRPLWDQ